MGKANQLGVQMGIAASFHMFFSPTQQNTGRFANLSRAWLPLDISAYPLRLESHSEQAVCLVFSEGPIFSVSNTSIFIWISSFTISKWSSHSKSHLSFQTILDLLCLFQLKVPSPSIWIWAEEPIKSNFASPVVRKYSFICSALFHSAVNRPPIIFVFFDITVVTIASLLNIFLNFWINLSRKPAMIASHLGQYRTSISRQIFIVKKNLVFRHYLGVPL